MKNGRFPVKIKKGGPYRVILTGYQPIRLQENRSLPAAI